MLFVNFNSDIGSTKIYYFSFIVTIGILAKR